MLNIIQNHYPERLGRALIINVPFIINAFFKIIMPFVDPVTRAKVKFNPDVVGEGLFTKNNLMTQWWGGDREFEWDHEQYWPTLVKMCKERKEHQMARWSELGAKVGLEEWHIKNGPDPGDDVAGRGVKLVAQEAQEEIKALPVTEAIVHDVEKPPVVVEESNGQFVAAA